MNKIWKWLSKKNSPQLSYVTFPVIITIFVMIVGVAIIYFKWHQSLAESFRRALPMLSLLPIISLLVFVGDMMNPPSTKKVS